jgi:hypothetical protein
MQLGFGTARQGYVVTALNESNISPAACRVQGFPVVTGWDSNTQLGSPSGHIGTGPGPIVTLQPQGMAHAELRLYDPTLWGSCHGAPLTMLKAQSPGVPGKFTIPFNQRGRLGCRTIGDHYLTVSPLAAGPGILALLP